MLKLITALVLVFALGAGFGGCWSDDDPVPQDASADKTVEEDVGVDGPAPDVKPEEDAQADGSTDAAETDAAETDAETDAAETDAAETDAAETDAAETDAT